MTQPLLSIIIVSFNTSELTQQCLNSVANDLDNSPNLKNQTEVWVVDNNSQDGSQQMLKSWQAAHPGLLHIIANTENVGFGSANNQAITKATGRYVFFLNSDTILKPGCLEQLTNRMQHFTGNDRTADLSSYSPTLDRLGILATSLLNPDGSPQPQGGSFPNLLNLAIHLSMLDDVPIIGKLLPSTQHTGHRQLKTTTSTLQSKDWVAATAMLVKKETLEEIGSFDQNIFMYGEDDELCMRAHQHHWDIAIDPLAEVTHFGSASSSSTRAIVGELTSYLYIWSKHYPDWQLPLVRLLIQIGARLRIFLFGRILRDKQRAEVYQEVLSKIPFRDRP